MRFYSHLAKTQTALTKKTQKKVHQTINPFNIKPPSYTTTTSTNTLRIEIDWKSTSIEEAINQLWEILLTDHTLTKKQKENIENEIAKLQFEQDKKKLTPE